MTSAMKIGTKGQELVVFPERPYDANVYTDETEGDCDGVNNHGDDVDSNKENNHDDVGDYNKANIHED